MGGKSALDMEKYVQPAGACLVPFYGEGWHRLEISILNSKHSEKKIH